jgi:hypothetical protein
VLLESDSYHYVVLGLSQKSVLNKKCCTLHEKSMLVSRQLDELFVQE